MEASTGQQKLLSVVVPCFNEEAVIEQTHASLMKALSGLGLDVEVIYVNDGSRDDTIRILRQLQVAEERVRVLSLSRNFGHQMAVSAGIDHVNGDAVVLIDADLQDPPEVISAMVARWHEGYHVVYGQRTDRPGETAFKLWSASMFYRLLNKLSDVPIPMDTGDFRLMDRKVVEVLRSMPERDRFLRGMVSWVGFRQIAVPYRRQPRQAGDSKYPLLKMVRFALDGIFSFSLVPLRLATLIGLFASLFATAAIVYAVILRLFTDIWVSGWTLMFVAIAFLGGAQLVCAGIIGEYLGRVYREIKRRPLYLIEEKLGFKDHSMAKTGTASPPSSAK